jgi:hypothetical protein
MIQIPAGTVTDLAGNQNSGDSTLTWQYDNE